MREIAKSCLLVFLLVLFAAACSKRSDGGDKKSKAQTEEVDDEEEEGDQQPWDCREVAMLLGWSPGQDGFMDAVDWCEGDAHRDADAFADLLSRKGKNCGKVLERLGEPKGVRKYEYLLMQCVKAASQKMLKCALAAPDNEKAIACGKWKHPYRPTYTNLFTGETTLQEGVEAPDEPLPIGDPEALLNWKDPNKPEEDKGAKKTGEKKKPLEFRDGKRRGTKQ